MPVRVAVAGSRMIVRVPVRGKPRGSKSKRLQIRDAWMVVHGRVIVRHGLREVSLIRSSVVLPVACRATVLVFARCPAPGRADDLFRIAAEPLPDRRGNSVRAQSNFNLLGEDWRQPPCAAHDFRRFAPDDNGGCEFVARSTRFGAFHALVVAPRPDNP